MQNLTDNIVYSDVFTKTARVKGYVCELGVLESAAIVKSLINGCSAGVEYIAITRVIAPALDIDVTIDCNDDYDKIIKTLRDYVNLLES